MTQTPPTVADLLAHPVRFGLTLLAGPGAGRPVEKVTAVATLPAVAHAAEGSLVVILEPPGAALTGYEADVAIRHAADRGLVALVLAAPVRLPVTSQHLAKRAQVPVLGSEVAQDGAELLLRIDRYVRGGASDALARAAAAIEAAQGAADAGSDDPVAAVLAAAGAALGCTVELLESAPADPRAPGAVVIGEQAVGELVAALPDEASQVALPAVAAVVSRVRQNELSRRFAATMTRAELIVQIVLAERAQLPQLSAQAQQAGLPVQQTHVVAWVRVEAARGVQGLFQQRQLLSALELAALQALDGRPGMWHVASFSGDLIVVFTDPVAGAHLYSRVRQEMRELLATLAERGDALVTIGMGTPQAGPDGIRQSAAEARVAADSAAVSGKRGTIADTDASGLRRILADLYSSPLSRGLLAELLAPLDALGPERSWIGVVTLSAFLDAQGSPTKTGRALHLHANAVSYRLRWITEALGADLDDPDVRFALQMACRVRLLGA
ncbi:PucR family transcriptional regulator [Nonomuraea sp. NPDC059194]|uniref:PucR family transcriptional regulator n=1 Tax=Nonomuraea sp. NPDC059194 TaxID=3346764 RepID=UPI0036BCE66A